MTPHGGPSLSIVFPCYNDAGTIGSLLAAADLVAHEFTEDHEIIVVDDGSQDSSRELLTRLQRIYPRLVVILHDGNKGYGAALRSGFARAKKDLVFYTDGDGQYDVFELRKLFPVLQEGVDWINGYKILRNDPFYRKLVGILYLRLMRLLFNFHTRDVDCDFRLMRRRVFDHIALKHDSGVICLELVKKFELAGYRSVDFPVHHYHRTYGRSQFFNFRRLLRVGYDIGRLWWELIVERNTPIGVAYPEEGRSRHLT
ncbi:MAG: glycosyltransferase family 2 protein [candidate division NC10 bacterium]|nr:glycosyltransferase family 2 protein [candidate division NC10 bacterium]